MSKDALGDRMKSYEMMEAGRRLMVGLPIVARLDGKNFSKATRNLERPYDERLSKIMVAVTRELVEETNANVGYTQSDEITLVWLYKLGSEPWFGGRVQKMCSVLASMCSTYFNLRQRQAGNRNGPLMQGDHFFDCRVWNVPTEEEAANAVLWRELDATKNSISMAARSVYSHKALHQKNAKEMQEMLFQKGINWNDYPDFFKRGTFIQRRKVVRPFTTDEISKLPAAHEARGNPDLRVERTEFRQVNLPRLLTIVNRCDVLFHGARPQFDSVLKMRVVKDG